MTRSDLEEALDEILLGKYHLTMVKGKLAIVTSLTEDDSGELVDDELDEVDDEDFEGDDE
jgi:hypothetical protein